MQPDRRALSLSAGQEFNASSTASGELPKLHNKQEVGDVLGSYLPT